jgi:hypothetical protein
MDASRISDDCRAWEVTHHDSYAHLSARVMDKEPTKKTLKPLMPTTEQGVMGPQVVRIDSLYMLRWTLLTHGGYVTYPHVDANGLLSWLCSDFGVKIWAILNPKYAADDDTRAKHFRLHGKMMNSPVSWTFEEASDMYTTFLSPGDVL